MKRFSVIITLDNGQRMHADFLTIGQIDLEKRYPVTIEGVVAHEGLNLQEQDKMHVELFFDKECQEAFDLVCDSYLSIPAGKNSLEGFFFGSSWLDRFHQASYSIMRSWSLEDGKVVDWRSLSDEGKWDWLLACLCWNRIRTTFSPKNEVIVDGLEVNSIADLYCHLGEVFFGFRGYLGMGLDGLWDCIRSFSLDDSNRVIHFKNFDRIRQVTDSVESLNGLEENYSHLLIKMFQERGFEIKMDH